MALIKLMYLVHTSYSNLDSGWRQALCHVQCLHDGRARDGAPTLAGGDFWSCRSRDGFLSLTKLFTSCSRACIKANRDLSAL